MEINVLELFRGERGVGSYTAATGDLEASIEPTSGT